MENVGFYTTLTRASNVSLSDSSVLSFFFLFSFFWLLSLAIGGGGRCLQANLLWMFAVFVKVKESFFFLKDDNNIIEVKFIMEDFIRVVKKKKLVT